MAHEIDLVSREDLNGSMAYTGDRPWHGLGQALDPNAPLEVWANQSGMDFEIAEAPALWYTGDTVESFDGRKILYRSDTKAGLSIVGSGYQVVQPLEVMEFYRDLLGDTFQMETAGVLFGGKRYWASAKLNTEARIMGQDLLEGYLLLASSCDGSLATTATFTSVRVVCNNTLSFAYDSMGERHIKIPHSVGFNPDEVKAKLGLAENAWSDFINTSTELAHREMSDEEAFEYFKSVIGDVESKAFKSVIGLYAGEGKGSDLRSAKRTAWGAVNAITEYVDHHRMTKTLDSRLDGNQWGKFANLKTTAFDTAVELLAA